jgi:predicted HicB family RNase H-like nuclease
MKRLTGVFWARPYPVYQLGLFRAHGERQKIPNLTKERTMTATSRKKAKPKAAAKSAKPRIAAKAKLAGGRKVTRKAPAKATKAKATTSTRSESGYEQFSGKFTVRLPKSLHQALVDRAEKEGVSLNLFVTNALSRTVAVSGGKGKR